jgi:hypothetical protein
MLMVNTEDPAHFATYWIMADLLTGAGDHEYEQFFHFAGSSQTQPAKASIDPETGAVCTENADSPNVYVVPADHHAGVRFVEAQETDMDPDKKREREAMLGWLVTDRTFNRVKSPVAAYTKEGEPPLSYYDVLFPVPERAQADIEVHRLDVLQDGQTLEPTQAAGLRIDITMDRPTYRPDELSVDFGENLAAEKPASGSVNEGTLPAGNARIITDRNPSPRTVGEAFNSTPYQPKTPLEGYFQVDLGEPTAVNMVVLHHGTWNGNNIIYPPEEFTVQYRADGQWAQVPNAQTIWAEKRITETTFDRVTTDALRAVVRRPSGGRIAMREFEAFNVADAERQRVERLRRDRETLTWTDYVLFSHEGTGERTCGPLGFDGECALVRLNESGEPVRAMMTHGSRLEFDGEVLVSRPRTRFLDVQADQFGTMTVKPQNPPAISDLEVQLHPRQSGIRGGQPYAFVNWNTDVPATSQVRYEGEDGLVRRTFFHPEETTDHSVRVDFLRDGHVYEFTAISAISPFARGEKTISAAHPARTEPE